MKLHRVVLSWGGPAVVGSAVSVLHFDGTEQPAPPVAAIKTALDAYKPSLPSTVTITTPSSGDSIEDTTGELVGVWTASGGGATVGTMNTGVAAGVGACIGWQTGGIVNGRKLRGRTFLAPLGVGCYDSDGTLLPTYLAATQTLAGALMAAGGLGIWHRPTTPSGSDGTSSSVLAYRVRDKVAYLSSRRD